MHSSADETFTLAGITISRTRVWADYVTGSGKAQKLRDYGCQLVKNYDPFSSISISKQNGILSGGQATYKCHVVVKRGVPTPWGQINTTTRSSSQYIRVSGPGIQSHGWSECEIRSRYEMNPLIPTPADVAPIIAFLVPIAATIWALGLWLSVRRKRRALERRADMTSVRPRRR